MDFEASTPRVEPDIEQQWPPKIESRWFSYRAAFSSKDVGENPEIPHRGTLLRFGDADNVKLEEAFSIRKDEFERCWYEEEAAVLAGPKGPKKVSASSTAATSTSTEQQQQPSTAPAREDTTAPDGSPSWLDFMAPDTGEEIGILVRSGSYEVDLSRRQLRPCYWPATRHRVLRGTWFAEKAVGEWVPLREFLADQLEQAYISQIWTPNKGRLTATAALSSPEKSAAAAVHAARLDLNTIVDVGLYALFVSENEAYLMRESSFSWLKHLPGASSAAAPTKLRLRRGYVAPTNHVILQKEADFASEAIDNSVANTLPTELVLVVHGIGQTLQRANIAEDALALRAGLRQIDKETSIANEEASSMLNNIGGNGGSNPTSPQKKSTASAAGTFKPQAVAGDPSKTAMETITTATGSFPTPLPYSKPVLPTTLSKAPSRVEVLPVQWRKTLSLEVDALAAALRPPGIPSLRQVLHSTAVEVLLYLTPLHRAAVLGSLVASLNSAYSRFMLRNPEFRGRVSIVAHSLGSILCWDILCNQPVSVTGTGSISGADFGGIATAPATTTATAATAAAAAAAEWSAAPVEISQLSFQVDQLILAGSPLGCFLALRGIDQSKNRGLGTPASSRLMQCHPDYDVIPDGLPAVRRVYHIYHPYDPVAYRLEPLAYSQSELARHRGALVELYGGGGGKRLHIAAQELGDSMTSAASRLGSTLAGALNFGRGQKRRGDETGKGGGGGGGVEGLGVVDKEQGSRQGDAAVAAIDAAFAGAALGTRKYTTSIAKDDFIKKSKGRGEEIQQEKVEKEKIDGMETDGKFLDTADEMAKAAAAAGRGAEVDEDTVADPMDFERPEFIPSTTTTTTTIDPTSNPRGIPSSSASASASAAAAATSISRVAGGHLPTTGGWPTAASGRIDFALQEASLENQYLAALKAHFIYWGSMDVALFIYRAVKGLDVVNGKPLVETTIATGIGTTATVPMAAAVPGIQQQQQQEKTFVKEEDKKKEDRGKDAKTATSVPDIVFGEADQLTPAPI